MNNENIPIASQSKESSFDTQLNQRETFTTPEQMPTPPESINPIVEHPEQALVKPPSETIKPEMPMSEEKPAISENTPLTQQDDAPIATKAKELDPKFVKQIKQCISDNQDDPFTLNQNATALSKKFLQEAFNRRLGDRNN